MRTLLSIIFLLSFLLQIGCDNTKPINDIDILKIAIIGEWYSEEMGKPGENLTFIYSFDANNHVTEKFEPSEEMYENPVLLPQPVHSLYSFIECPKGTCIKLEQRSWGKDSTILENVSMFENKMTFYKSNADGEQIKQTFIKIINNSF